MVKTETAYGRCENCGHEIAKHCAEDVADCLASWRPVGAREPQLREKIHASLRDSADFCAALALYWWIHETSEDALGESWPWTWERSLHDLVHGKRSAHEREPTAESLAAAQDLAKAAGGWWWAVDEDPVFVATGSGHSVDADCSCFGADFWTHSRERCPNRLRQIQAMGDSK